jgi:hypothetical protein
MKAKKKPIEVWRPMHWASTYAAV